MTCAVGAARGAAGDPRANARAPMCVLAGVVAVAVTLCRASTAPRVYAELSPEDTGGSEAVELSRAAVDLNAASFEELCSVPGISPPVASAIVDRRMRLGRLRSLDDLLGAGGLSEPELSAIKPYVKVDGRCRVAGTRVDAKAALWVDARGAGRGRGLSRAADVRLDAGSLRLRFKRRRSYIGFRGGGVLRAGSAIVVVGDVICRDTPALAFNPGRGVLTFGGPLPRAAGFGVEGPGAIVTTASGERFRGMALTAEGGAVAAGGVIVDPWGGESGPAAVLSVPVLRDKRRLVRCGVVAWERRPTGAAWAWAEWGNKLRAASGEMAVRGTGGAWLAELSSRPGRDRTLAVVLAGRWGRYANPFGPGLFRVDGAARVAWRMRCSARLRYVGSLTFEELVRGGGDDVRYLKRGLSLRTRLRRGLWSECEARGEGKTRGGWAENVGNRLGVKLLWRPSRPVRIEILLKARVDGGARSWLRGWRVSVDRRTYSMEAGGFSFDAERSLYFYEREIVGLPSIKTLKGEGAGWYLCLRLEPQGGFRPMSFIDAAEFKIGTVVGRRSGPGGLFMGVQLGRG